MQAISQSFKIKNNHCQASFHSIEPCCGSVRVEGWITAPDRSEGFDFCGVVAHALNKAAERTLTNYLGGFCLEDEKPVNFPFSFDVQPPYLWKFYRHATVDETIALVWKALRKARNTGIISTGIA